MISKRFRAGVRRYGLQKDRVKLRCDLFERPLDTEDQLSLF
ncbi:hypothetical protein [Oceanicaulis alexandrii]|nr:hypothetical protein [Oceanicaulis alexandrii]